MYNNGKIIIDTRKLDMYDIFERYQRGLLFFFEKRNIVKSQKRRVINEVLEALSRGIPLPPVYVSELQTGEMLVLDKSDRLRFLMEYTEHVYGRGKEESDIAADRFLRKEFENPDFMRDVFYAEVILYVIDYWNPKYMHMQVGAFIEEWTAVQEQSVRNILYDGSGMHVLAELLREKPVSRQSEFNMQYSFIYFIMVHFIAIRKISSSKYRNADKFQLLEKSLSELNDIKLSYLRDLRDLFMDANYLLRTRFQRVLPIGRTQEVKTKYLCFIGAFMLINGENHMDELFENREIKYRMTECDMSFRSVNLILEDFRRGFYDN